MTYPDWQGGFFMPTIFGFFYIRKFNKKTMNYSNEFINIIKRT
jgi:hypothetical protein